MSRYEGSNFKASFILWVTILKGVIERVINVDTFNTSSRKGEKTYNGKESERKSEKDQNNDWRHLTTALRERTSGEAYRPKDPLGKKCVRLAQYDLGHPIKKDLGEGGSTVGQKFTTKRSVLTKNGRASFRKLPYSLRNSTRYRKKFNRENQATGTREGRRQ